MKATAKDLRFHAKELLETVSRGEEVVITHRGKPCAKLVPIERPAAKPAEELELFGIWSDHKESKDVARYVRGLRKGRF